MTGPGISMKTINLITSEVDLRIHKSDIEQAAPLPAGLFFNRKQSVGKPVSTV